MHCLAGLDMGRHSVMLRQPAQVLRQYSVSLGCSLVNVACYKYGCATHGWLVIGGVLIIRRQWIFWGEPYGTVVHGLFELTAVEDLGI